MKQIVKYAAASKAIALMKRPGGQGRSFFNDLMKRQKGLNDFDVDDQMTMLKNLEGVASGDRLIRMHRNQPDGIKTLKRLLRQGSSYADDYTHVHSMLPRLNDLIARTGTFTTPGRARILRLPDRRQKQLDAADDHAFVLRQQQKAKRNDAAVLDRLLSKI